MTPEGPTTVVDWDCRSRMLVPPGIERTSVVPRERENAVAEPPDGVVMV
jgi:hypothetical protein